MHAHAPAVLKPRLIAVTGGIGSGKSVVCRILSAMGYRVYDSDSRAKAIMDADRALVAEIGLSILPEAVRPDGTLNRPLLAQAVFADDALMARLNALVHGAVRADIRRWAELYSADSCLFIETAILCTSGLDRIVSDVWLVTAPESLRIRRVMKRNCLDETQVIARIRAQQSEALAIEALGHRVSLIINDGQTAILPQVLGLLHGNK